MGVKGSGGRDGRAAPDGGPHFTGCDPASERAFIEQLAAAGCDDCLVRKCCCLRRDNMTPAMRVLLQAHRGELIEELHRTQREIDCLDVLLLDCRQRPGGHAGAPGDGRPGGCTDDRPDESNGR